MRCSPLSLPIALFLSLATFATASAQYLYLDTNGDGVHTSADVLAPTGATSLEVWIRTDHNRDGSLATCDTGDGDLTINGYEVILHGSNGTLAWGAVTQRIAAFTIAVTTSSSDVDLHCGAYGADQAPGTYDLATIAVTPASGTPRIEIAPDTPLGATFFTGFGSRCSGLAFSNILTLGSDWFDTDGVEYGGAANHPPTIDAVPALVVTEGATLDQPLTARDQDGDPVQLTKIAGPPFASVATTDPGSGVASGVLSLAPGYSDSGATVVTVGASDGIAVASLNVPVTVRNQDRPPSMDQPSPMNAIPLISTSQDLHATDPDGGFLRFSLASGPAYATVTTVESFSPAVGRITLLPPLGSPPTDSAIVAVTDGELEARRTVQIHVFQSSNTIPLLCRPADMTIVAGTSADQTLTASVATRDPITFSLEAGPSFLSVTTESTQTWPAIGRLRANPAASDLGDYSALIRADAGTSFAEEALRIHVVDHLAPSVPGPDRFTSTSRSYDVCQYPQSVVLADLDEDGVLDLVVANRGCGLSLLFGLGGGRFGNRRNVVVPAEPMSANVGDFDGDGHLDVAVANGYGGQIVLFRGDGHGGLAFWSAFTAGPNPVHVAVGDLNHDGIPDLVSANMDGSSITIFLGTGGGAFTRGATYPAGLTPCYTEIEDLNHDGIPDLVEANEGSSAVAVYLGKGDGTFLPKGLTPTGKGPASVDIGDFDRDGNPDLAVADFETQYLTILFGDGAGAFGRRIDLQTGTGPWSVFAADLNGDGNLDAVTANTADNDVTICLGNGNGTFAAPIRAPAGALARYVTGADLTGDGRIDLVVANEGGADVSVMIGAGGGRFGSATTFDAPAPLTGLSEGDLTGDGIVDIAASIPTLKEVAVYPGLGGGRFGAPVVIALGGTPGETAIADLNGDGAADLAVTLQDVPSIAVIGGGPNLGQSPPTLVPCGFGTRLLRVGDWNKDGFTDLAAGGYQTPSIALLDGDGHGGFTNLRDVPLSSGPAALARGDWDGDGFLDLAVAVGDMRAQLYWGDGSGFTPGPVVDESSPVAGLEGADLHNDGRASLIITTQGTFGGSFLRVPHGLIDMYRWPARDAVPVRSFFPGGAGAILPRVADVNQDGLPDIVSAVTGYGGIGVTPAVAGGTFGSREDYGSGSLVTGLAVGDLNGDGFPDVASVDFIGPTLTIHLNRGAATAPPLQARAFVPPDDRTLRLQAAKPTWCVHLEPVDKDFALTDVIAGSIQMGIEGQPTEIASSGGARTARSDSDGNGVDEITACFAKDDLRRLFAGVHGSVAEPVTITGSLASGRAFRAALPVTVVGASKPLVASVAPNPLNPRATLSFAIEQPGRVRVLLFDVHGRLVTRAFDANVTEPGEVRIPIGDGAPHAGRLASGIYFYRIDAPEGSVRGRFAVLK